MSNFDESLYSVSLESTHGDYAEFDDSGNPILPSATKYSLSEREELCFKCPLADCKENSKKCLINIAAEAKK